MDYGPLVREEIETGREIIEKFNAYRPVKAAFWLKSGDDSQRYLYIASDDFNERSPREGYADLAYVMDTVDDKEFSEFWIKLIGTDEPLAQEAIKISQKFPTAMGARFGRQMFGNVYAEDGYLYAMPVTNSAS